MTEQASKLAVTLALKGDDANYRVFALTTGEGGERAADEVDVVLVHGLTGDAEKTWGLVKDKKGVVSGWPADLARDLKGAAMIWTLGYQAPLFDTQLGIIAQSSEDEADRALNGLLAAGLGNRPLIFVAHSLGGLLVKALLYCSRESDDPSWQAIAKKTRAVCFLSTPHSGSDQTKWRFLLPSIVKWAVGKLGIAVLAVLGVFGIAGGVGAVSLLGRTWPITVAGLVSGVAVPVVFLMLNKRLAPGRHVLRLDPDQPELYNLTNKYRSLVRNSPIATDAFYEGRNLWGLFRVVPRSSADPGVTDCKPVPIYADHNGICKKPAVALAVNQIKKRVRRARLGKDQAVFGEALLRELGDVETTYPEIAPLIAKGSDGSLSFVQRFKNVELGTRAGAEAALRERLRVLIQKGHLVPTEDELGLCVGSPFDIDEFVWKIWHEHVLTDILRDLRRKAVRAQKRWDAEFQQFRNANFAADAPSLMPFYRSLRTIEHACLGDLGDLESGGGKIDRAKLLKVIDDAYGSLSNWCPKMIWTVNGTERALDKNAATRYLLLRLQCALRAIDAAVRFVEVGRGGHEDTDLHAETLKRQSDQFDKALEEFHKALGVGPQP